jgi:DNA-binding NarL/FixJ family response regulator
MKEKIKIAIAEDEGLVRSGFRAVLKEVPNFDVVLNASNGKELIDKLAAAEELPNIILMDLNMPVLNGVEATKIVREKHPDIQIIALTSYNSTSFILSMIKIGASAYILKNENPDSLILAINGVYENGFYYDRKVLEVLKENAIHPTRAREIQFTYAQLTDRELQVLELICRQYTTTEIGEKLFISPRTVEGHRNNLLQKTGMKNVVGLVVYAIKNELVDIPNNSFS